MIKTWLKQLAQQNDHLYRVLRATKRTMFNPEPKPPRMVQGVEPLRLEETRLTEFGAISPNLPDEILAEFRQISRVLGGDLSCLNAGYQWWAQHPLDNLLSNATEANIVYTPGKVGSGTVAATLQKHLAPSSPIRHVHFLSEKGLAYVERLIQRCAARPAAATIWRDTYFLGRWLRALVAVNRALRKASSSNAQPVRKPFVVAGVREPVALHISFCFEGHWMYGDSLDVLTADFVHDRLADDAWQLHSNNWFSNDLKEMFGVDVYATPFPTARGWEIYENESARVLLIRQESLAHLSDGLGALYGMDPSALPTETANTADGKAYAARYKNVRNAFRLSAHEIDEIYNLPYARHFYTPSEIAEFSARWQPDVSRQNAA